MTDTITQVESELQSALASLEGWAEGVLVSERARIEELCKAWRVQARRIREMDGLLRQIRSAKVADATAPDDPDASVERVRHCEEVRRGNLARLAEVRRSAYQDLMGTLAWVRELVSMIHLAKFTGAPASRAEQLVAQIAAAVEGLSEVTTWRETSVSPASA